MKRARYLLLGVIPLMASCASRTVIQESVGPNPFRGATTASTGYLRVFTERELVTEGFNEGANPSYHQHSDYRVYDERGKLVRYVGNSVGKYDSSPRVISLPPGRYIVGARAKDYLAVEVPVVVERGRMTSVHLDDRWTPPAEASTNEIVYQPDGRPLGWGEVSSNR